MLEKPHEIKDFATCKQDKKYSNLAKNVQSRSLVAYFGFYLER